MIFENYFSKVKTWALLFVEWFIDIISIFLPVNKPAIEKPLLALSPTNDTTAAGGIALPAIRQVGKKIRQYASALSATVGQFAVGTVMAWIVSWTIIYFAPNVWKPYVARLITESVIFTFAFSQLAERTSRRVHLLLSRGRSTDDRLRELKDDIHSISVTDEHRTTDDRLGALEEAVRSLTAQFAAFAENRVKTHHATKKHAPTSLVQQARNRTWCYYHERYGSDARKCGSDECTFAITKKKPLKHHQTTMKLNGNYYQRYRENV